MKPNPRLQVACAIFEDEPDRANAICQDILRDNPDDGAALFLIGTINAKADRYGTALACFERVTKLNPRRAEAWNNLGMAYQECSDYVKSAECFKRAFELEPKPSIMANLGSAYVSQGNYAEAIRWCRKALEKEPENPGAKSTMGFAQLAQGNWADGWKNYEYCLGGRFRKEVKVGDEPRWDGSPVDKLFIYGEQGLGDELMYASILPDAQKHAKQITLECDKRIKGLLQRSFPKIEVFGTRREQQFWAHDRVFDAGCGAASLASLFRHDKADCPRKPYLVADPERRLQWRALFDSWGKPVIGLTWSGGRAATHRKAREVGVEAFRPLIESRPDAVFVSLQYTDATEEIKASGLPIRHIHRGSQSPDYDDTAAFVAELDSIVGIHTTVHHLAGGLGVPSTILVPSRPMWLYATGDRIPFYAEQVFHRQKQHESWKDCVKRLCSA